MSCNRIFYFSFVVKNFPSLQLTRFKKHKSQFLYLCNLAIKIENWNMKNEFSIFNFLIKIEHWKLKIFYHWKLKFEIEICKNVFFDFNFKPEIEWHFWRTDSTDLPKVSFNFHFKIGMEKDISAHFSFYLKIENRKITKYFQFSIFKFYLKTEKWKFIFKPWIEKGIRFLF